jgi:hypothetical protein
LNAEDTHLWKEAGGSSKMDISIIIFKWLLDSMYIFTCSKFGYYGLCSLLTLLGYFCSAGGNAFFSLERDKLRGLSSSCVNRLQFITVYCLLD